MLFRSQLWDLLVSETGSKPTIDQIFELANYSLSKHVVFEEGITEINKINNSFFGDVNSACDVTVPESATSFDATNVSIKLTLYGLDGSWFYGEFGIRENTSQEYISIGTAKNPLYPASGTCTSGATWTFDYRTRELHISGSTMRTDEMPKLPCSKYMSG